jgi:hypothetical protein
MVPVIRAAAVIPSPARDLARGLRQQVVAADHEVDVLAEVVDDDGPTRTRPLAGVELDVADDLDARFPGLAHHPMRLGVGERHPRRQHEGGEAAPVGGREILHRNPAPRG